MYLALTLLCMATVVWLVLVYGGVDPGPPNCTAQ